MKGRGTRRWLLAVDGSPGADKAAAYVARCAMQLRVDEVDALQAFARELTLPEAQERSRRDTEAAGALLRNAGIAHRFHVALGDAAMAIVERSRSEPIDEIVVGSRGMGAITGAVLGSVAYKVVHQADLPVTVVGDRYRPPAAPQGGVHRVLLAVDGSEHAQRAGDYLCAFAGEHIRIDVVLVNVQLPIVSGNVRLFVSQELIDNYHRQEGEEALASAKTALTNAGIRFEPRVLTGHVSPAIVQLAEERGCDRIVMGTRGLGAVGTVVLGSIAYRVLHEASLPVTLVK
jgi:nucleotide-binding universal stress UspA family protein